MPMPSIGITNKRLVEAAQKLARIGGTSPEMIIHNALTMGTSGLGLTMESAMKQIEEKFIEGALSEKEYGEMMGSRPDPKARKLAKENALRRATSFFVSGGINEREFIAMNGRRPERRLLKERQKFIRTLFGEGTAYDLTHFLDVGACRTGSKSSSRVIEKAGRNATSTKPRQGENLAYEFSKASSRKAMSDEKRRNTGLGSPYNLLKPEASRRRNVRRVVRGSR